MNSDLGLLVGIGLLLLLGLGALALIRWRSRAAPPPTVEELGPPAEQMPPLPAEAHLQAEDANGNARTFPLTQAGNLIGRAEHADIHVDESFAHWDTVSREHARIEFQGDRVIVMDNNSLNGITVNGRRTGRNLLKHGWRLEIGGVAFTFHIASEDSSP
jgi:pSer/pThr/pTyr-binding forkhead associated (FHA) protein